jgi:hypothetical protein
MADNTITLRCACMDEHLDIDLYLEFEDEPAAYLTISTAWNREKRWRTIWDILRGREHYFNAVILTPADVTKMADFLAPYQTKGE